MKQKPTLYDIYDIIQIPWWQRQKNVITLILGLVVSVILVVMILYIIKGKKIKNHMPWELALRKLYVLQKKGCPYESDIHCAYMELTDILKQYFSARYSVNMIGYTEVEVDNALQSFCKNDDFLNPMNEVLSRAIMAKFARGSLDTAQFERDIATCIMIINRTIPVASDKQ